MRTGRTWLVLVITVTAMAAQAASENPFLGEWALTVPGGYAGWLGVVDSDGKLEASMMWRWGSVDPVAVLSAGDDRMALSRKIEVEQKLANGKTVKTNLAQIITATVHGDGMELSSVTPRRDGTGEDRAVFHGQRQPPMPPAPDLSKLKLGKRLKLFNGKDLSGWRLTDPTAANGWSVKDGILINNPVQEEGKPHKNYGNLRTDREFGDCNLTLEVRVPPKGNSGVYMRGIYEIQVADTFGQPLDSHNMGAVYSRIRPAVNAEKPAGEWQTLDITLVDRHMTVILNGKRIIDNQPVLGCTGGALFSDVTRPGPIYLQGDHAGVEYRKIFLRPVLK